MGRVEEDKRVNMYYFFLINKPPRKEPCKNTVILFFNLSSKALYSPIVFQQQSSEIHFCNSNAAKMKLILCVYSVEFL